MNRKILLLATALTFSLPVYAGLPEALMNLEYQQYGAALSDFQALAAKGNATAYYHLGQMYKNGLGVQPNIMTAMQYFQEADKRFYLPAATQLGKALLSGENNIRKNPDLAIRLLKKAALAGDSEALYELGNASYNGFGNTPNFNNAFGYYMIAALKGNMKAQYQLGQMYLSGRGVPQDFSKALTWMSRAANQGYVLAQMEVAKQTETNPQLRNILLSYSWNSIIAAYNSDEIGQQAAVKRDELSKKIQAKSLQQQQAKIRSWKPKAPEETVPAEEKQKDNPVIVGFNDPKTLQQILLEEGTLPQDATDFGLRNTLIDIAEATGDRSELTAAVEKAISVGNKGAAAYYGDLLYKRFHLPEEAVKWYQKGADIHEDYAQYQLAKSYCEGWAGVVDIPTCYAWMLINSETKNPVLNDLIHSALRTIRSGAQPADLERGQQMKEEIITNSQKSEKEKKIFDLF